MNKPITINLNECSIRIGNAIPARYADRHSYQTALFCALLIYREHYWTHKRTAKKVILQAIGG